jgi:multidrug efflux system outer membrane protein
MKRLRMKPAAVALAAAWALSACMQLAPTYERPAAPVAERFPSLPGERVPAVADTGPATTAAAAELPWTDFFREPRLRRLIEIALENNRDLRVAVLNIEAARAQAGLRQADRLPTVNAAVTGSRQPGANGSIASTYTAGFAVSAFELDLFGRVRSLTDAALAQLAASEQARRAAHIALVASVANLHYALAGDEELLALTRRTLATREESLRLMRLRFDNGAASELDLRLAESLAEAARLAAAQQERQRAQDRNALELAIGQPLPADLPPAAAWNPDLLADVPAGLPSEVLLQRPDVRQAEEQLRAANASIGAARAAFWPRIALTASVGTASSHLSDLFSNGTAWAFMPQMLMPIFDAGRNRSNLQLSQAQRDIAVAQYERAVQAAFRDVADALAGRATLGEQLRAARGIAEAESARYRLVGLRVQHGASNSLDRLDAERSLFTAQQQLVQAQAALLQNRITAYRALGGGWVQ